MMIDRRLVEYFDWWMLALTTTAAAIGMVALYSAVNAGSGTEQTGLFTRQLIWYGAGAIVMITAFLINYKSYERWGHLFYFLCIGLLVAVFLFGKYVGGSKRWLAMGPVSIQPSEMVKLAVIIMLAKYYARVVRTDGLQFRELLTPAIITAVPFALIVRQPDLGTAMVVALIAASMTLYVDQARHPDRTDR